MELFSKYWHLFIIAGILLWIVIGFIVKFVRPAKKLGRTLRHAISGLKQIKNRPDIFSDKLLADIENELMQSEKLKHLWQQYTETLHPEKEADESGQEKIVRWRATAVSGFFFTENALVDSVLKTEFYKHVPGILTGLCLIGTFTGLIRGLSSFDPSSNVDTLKTELGELFKSVGMAFFVSASAITLAMLFIWIEKHFVTVRYKDIEDLCSLIDSLFEAGANEEYLARLVKASESSATQALQIKDALVSDLRQILMEVTDKQLANNINQNRELSQELVKGIADNLGGPIQNISRAVSQIGSNQGEAVNTLLTDVLSNFATRMQDMFGDQLKGTGTILQEATHAIQTTVARFDDLASKMRNAGEGAADAMSEKLTEAINSLEVRQQVMNRQMGEFVAQIKLLIQESQTETAKEMQATLTKLGTEVSAVINLISIQASTASEKNQERQAAFSKQTTETISTLSSQTEELIRGITVASSEIGKNIDKLTSQTTEAIDRMNTGAETLYVAASDFAKAGDGVTGVLKSSSHIAETLTTASEILKMSLVGTQQVLADYKQARETFAMIVSELKATVNNASKEASLTSELIEQMKTGTNQLVRAQQEAEDYLNKVSSVLTNAHEVFANNITKTLQTGNAQFHKELSTAVGFLRGGIEDLGVVIQSVPSGKK